MTEGKEKEKKERKERKVKDKGMNGNGGEKGKEGERDEDKRDEREEREVYTKRDNGRDRMVKDPGPSPLSNSGGAFKENKIMGGNYSYTKRTKSNQDGSSSGFLGRSDGGGKSEREKALGDKSRSSAEEPALESPTPTSNSKKKRKYDKSQSSGSGLVYASREVTKDKNNQNQGNLTERRNRDGKRTPTSSSGSVTERGMRDRDEKLGGELMLGANGRLEVGQVLGRGLTGTVHLAKDAENQRYAVKIVDKDNLVSAFRGFEVTREDLLRNLEKEIKIMGSLHHRNIVHLVDTFQIDDKYYICMELVEGKDLLSLVPQGGLKEQVAKDYFFQLCSAIAYCHSNNIIHGDLKPENILIRSTDSRIKLIDFGFSHFVTGEPLKIIGNTVLYSPPCDAEMSFAWDAWALGIILYAMLVCSLPFTENQLTNSSDLELAVPPQIPAETYEIFEGFLNPDSTQRTPVGEMIAVSKWLKSERAKAIPESFSHPVKRPPPSQNQEKVAHTVQVVPLSAKESAPNGPPPGLVRAERKPFNNPFQIFGKKKDKKEKKKKEKRKELKRVRDIDGDDTDNDTNSSPVYSDTQPPPAPSSPPPSAKQKSLSGSFLKMQDKILRGLPSDDMSDLFKKTPRAASSTSSKNPNSPPSMKSAREREIQRGFSNSPSSSSSFSGHDRDSKGGSSASPPPLPGPSFALSPEQADLLSETEYLCLVSNLTTAEMNFTKELQQLNGFRQMANKETKIFFEIVESMIAIHLSIGETLIKSRGLEALISVCSVVESNEFEKQHRLYQQYHATAVRFFLQTNLPMMSKTTVLSLLSAPMRQMSHYITLYTSFYCVGIDSFHETTFADQILRLKMIFANV